MYSIGVINLIIGGSNYMKNKQGLGTFDGVYTPTVLTILGVIMYLRLGWVVGNAGLLGALAIIIIAHVITFCTALSMSSMLTNIDIGAGGAYTIIARSLGMEMGGAIGIPLYFSQAISAAFYITGFTELWISFFPNHSIQLVGLATWFILALFSIISAKLAFRVQYIILVAVALSLLSFFMGSSLNPGGINLIGDFSKVGFWGTFAIFFPAVTGILAGASMSGEIKDPRKSIVKGTLAAVGTGFIVYILVALWFARQASTEQLLTNNFIILEIAFSTPLIVAGIMGAIISSALSTLVSAPRTLAALAENRATPFSSFLATKASNHEPRNAIILSSLISLSVLLFSNLNFLAALLTLFFLTTYGMINLVVLIEQAIGIISFRPRLSLSIFVPIVGLLGCIFAMLLINRVFTLITICTIIFIYYILNKRNLTSPWGDVRGGLFTSLAEWAAQKAMSMPYHPKLWRPSIVIPVETPEDFRRVSRFIGNIVSPSGRLYYLTIYEGNKNGEKDLAIIDDSLLPLIKEGIFAHKIIIQGKRFDSELQLVFQGLLSTFLPPNTAFFTVSEDPIKQSKFITVLNSIKGVQIGIMCLYLHPKYAFGQEKKINLWLRDKSPNNSLAVLSALQLKRNWNAQLHLFRIVSKPSEADKAEKELHRFIEDARLPVSTKVEIRIGKFPEIVSKEPGDLNILGMPNQYEQMFETIKIVPRSIIFVADSGLESILA